MANKIAAIGKRDAILPYKAIGVEIYITEEKNEFKTIIEKLVKEKYAIV
ncbi:V-type ATP synthase subunit F, partial [candidate division WOR-3 bacterium]|nr:V-type ATP synthase subunit F [candidate division WOR-3 bacterium]